MDKPAVHCFPPGHFYSPYPDLDIIRMHEEEVFGLDRSIPEVDLNEEEQKRNLEMIAGMLPMIPFTDAPQPGFRYYYDNPAYAHADGVVLCSMLRHIRPKRIVEVGSGFSSCAVLDTIDRFLGGDVQCTFIEPYPDLLRKLTAECGMGGARLIPKTLQAVGLDLFRELQAGDILLVDSSHVCKAFSDVNRIIFEILPALADGVYIHFHDIFYPFEYPKKWIYEGRAWSEAYLLRAFLQNNLRYRIIYWQHMMMLKHVPFIEKHLPLFFKNGGGNFWLAKTQARPSARGEPG